LGLEKASPLAAVQLFARLEPGAPWISLGPPVAAARFGRTAAGVRIPLTWPQAWRRNRVIAAELKIVMAFDAGVAAARLDRIALYPGDNARELPARNSSR
jgi:hypothetical protein